MYTIEKLKKCIVEIHGNKYDYSWDTYVKKTEKMKIICPVHGEFWQSLHEHIDKKQGCPKCGVIKRSENKLYDFSDFVKCAKLIHGDKYIYNEKDYHGYKEKMKITCPIHGDFYQVPTHHVNSKEGCPQCGLDISKNIKRRTKDEFIKLAKQVHVNKYDYSKSEYINSLTKTCIICPIHGEFYQTPYSHIKGCGCPKCGDELRGRKQVKGTDNFIKESILVHGDKYDYSKVHYKGILDPVVIICKKHGEFKQVPSYHLSGNGCPICGKTISKAEEEIYNFCCEQIGEENVQQRNRLIIHPYELDIYLRSLGYAIEYNGLRWHSEKFGKDRYYHLNKLNACKEKGIKLIQIFEDEYINKRDIVYNKLKHIMKLDQNLPRIPGRKCVIKEITAVKAKEFLNKYHIQGYIGSKVYLGAFHNEELVAVMTFKTLDKCNNWELTRFASNYNYICQGVGGKLFTHFIKNYNPEEIKSFADRRWTINEENNIYIKLGFKFDSYTNPDYHYYREEDGPIRQHKFAFRKNRLNKKYGLPLSMTEEEMTENLGYTRIYDCGLIKYTWDKKREA